MESSRLGGGARVSVSQHGGRGYSGLDPALQFSEHLKADDFLNPDCESKYMKREKSVMVGSWSLVLQCICGYKYMQWY